MGKLIIEKGDDVRFADHRLISLTDAAINKIQSLVEREPKNVALRVNVAGGGCSGLNYEIEFTSQLEPLDLAIDIGPTYVLISPKSALYIKGTSLDYSNKMIAGGFKFSNPNAKTSCSCGDSFGL